MKKSIILALTVSSLALAQCSNRSQLPSSGGAYGAPSGVVGSSAGLVNNPPMRIAPMQGNYSDFAGWKSNFFARARASGISEAAIRAAEPYFKYSASVVSSDRSQSEFVKPIWEYVESAVSSRRAKGRSKAAQYGSALTGIENRFKTDRDVLMGIWGMETNFGGFTGNTSIFTSMATLAYEGRRRDFAETQLINALHIIDRGDQSAAALKGSWGGGLGQTQFIPESYNRYGLDYTGDGRRNLWEPTEALASTANYLRNEGWTPSLPWGVEVRLPQGFNYLDADSLNFKPSNYWKSQGVQSLSPRGLPNAELAIFLPAGQNGPAFAITRNFHAIKRYNPSDAYALAVGLVGDVAFGLPGVQASWPRHEGALKRSEIKAAQQRLMSMGYDTGGADGIAGRGTRKAVQQFQASIGMVPDGFLNRSVYQRIMQY